MRKSKETPVVAVFAHQVSICFFGYFSDKNIFPVDAKVNHTNDLWLTQSLEEVTGVTRTKFLASVHVFRFVSSEKGVLVKKEVYKRVFSSSSSFFRSIFYTCRNLILR